MELSPGRLFLIGFLLVFAGFIIPLLMVLHVVPASFTLSFLGYMASTAGLIMGLVGAAIYVQVHKKDRDK